MIDESRPVIDEHRRNVYSTWIEVRRPSAFDQGEIAFVHYVVDGGVVALTDAQGQPCIHGNGVASTIQIGPRQDAASAARRLARKAFRERQARHGSPMLYEQIVIV